MNRGNDPGHGWADRRAETRPTCRRASRRAFTLTEMLIVVAVMAVVAGAIILLSSGALEHTDERMVRAECAAIRDAALQFRGDMGRPPRRIAELLQSPDPTDSRGGWWWRDDGTPDPTLYEYDPATRRGWGGPYLHADDASDAGDETVEPYLVATAAYRNPPDESSADRRLTILLSRYSTFPQKTDGDRLVSHYQFDASEADEPAVRFVADPTAPAGDERVVCRLVLGTAP